MKTVGITGGIGSGKTTVCKIFELLQVPVYYADEQARSITDSDLDVVSKIQKLFGNDVYESNRLNRPKVAAIVFSNPEMLQQLNAIVHPAVDASFCKWKNQHQNVPYIIKEAAILFESGMFASIDYLVTVSAPVELRIARIIKRDRMLREQVLDRMKNQWPDEKKIALSHQTIYCDEQQLVIPQVLNLHYKLLNL